MTAIGRMQGTAVLLGVIERYASLDDWTTSLSENSNWVGGFDLPFGLPRELTETLGWPADWMACVSHFCAMDRSEVRSSFKAFCDQRPAGAKFAHRLTDRPAGSSPSMKWVNPPVAFMMHAGLPALLKAGVCLPGLHPGDDCRVALEAYPGMLARSVLGSTSYKSDDKSRQTPQRLLARRDLVEALNMGSAPLLRKSGLRLRMSHAQRDELVEDPTGDTLDAVLCMMEAAWALKQHEAGHACWGLPPFDPLEGWIVSAGEHSTES
ncbi:hypothetical protein NBRC116584_00110 [Hydrogenophaga sp. 5NK40-0174]